MLVFTVHAGIYESCWYLRFMLVFTIHAGIYDSSCWYLRFMLVFTIHAGIYDPCWYLRSMLVFMIFFSLTKNRSNVYNYDKSEIQIKDKTNPHTTNNNLRHS